MRQRQKALRKILALQDQLKDLSAWKLAALDQHRAALDEAQKETIEAIDRDAISQGIIVVSATRRLRNLDKRIVAVKAEQVAQAQRAQEQAMRAKLAERLVENVEARLRMQRERVDLADLIEHSVAGKTASPA
jgi:hypothetical protein